MSEKARIEYLKKGVRKANTVIMVGEVLFYLSCGGNMLVLVLVILGAIPLNVYVWSALLSIMIGGLAVSTWKRKAKERYMQELKAISIYIICTKCGKELPKNDIVFCPYCGKPLKE